MNIFYNNPMCIDRLPFELIWEIYKYLPERKHITELKNIFSGIDKYEIHNNYFGYYYKSKTILGLIIFINIIKEKLKIIDIVMNGGDDNDINKITFYYKNENINIQKNISELYYEFLILFGKTNKLKINTKTSEIFRISDPLRYIYGFFKHPFDTNIYYDFELLSKIPLIDYAKKDRELYEKLTLRNNNNNKCCCIC